MKKSLLLLLVALMQLAAVGRAQNTGIPVAGGQTPQANAGEVDAWTDADTDAVRAAVAKKDRGAIAQIMFDYAKRVTMGMSACGHTIDQPTIFEATSSNESLELAMVIRWLDPRSATMHSAVFTGRQRCVAMDGMTASGKFVVQVLANSMAMSRAHALVAWEAYYWNSLGEAKPGLVPHRGLFIENQFVTEIDPAKASPAGKRELDDKDLDFKWIDEPETVSVKPGVALAPPAVPSKTQGAKATSPCPAQSKKPPTFADRLKQRAERALQSEAKKADAATVKATGGALDGGASDAANSVIAEANSSVCPPAKGQAK